MAAAARDRCTPAERGSGSGNIARVDSFDSRFFTARKRSCEKVMLHRHLSVHREIGTSHASWDMSHGTLSPSLSLLPMLLTSGDMEPTP